MKICTKCKNSKDLTYFYKNRTNKDGLSIWCEVRGLLCYSCNSGLALFKENKAIFINAMEYLGLDT